MARRVGNCGGDLGAGKYNDGSPMAREELSERLYQGWKAAWVQTRKYPLERVAVHSIPLRLEPKDSAGFRVSDLDAIVTGANKTSFDVVTVTESSLEEQTAAQWLSETLEQVTGAKYPIRAAGAKAGNDATVHQIRVLTDSTLKPEEWRIQMSGDSLLLTGGRPRGTIYAVCEFLETHIGVERLDPFTEFVPKQPTLTIPALNRHG